MTNRSVGHSEWNLRASWLPLKNPIISHFSIEDHRENSSLHSHNLVFSFLMPRAVSLIIIFSSTLSVFVKLVMGTDILADLIAQLPDSDDKPSVELVSERDPKLYDFMRAGMDIKRTVFPTEGQDTELHCDNGKETMEFDEFKFFWRKDNVTFTIDGSKYILAVGGKLTIRNTTTSDSGLYSCVIMSADDTFKKIMPPYKLTVLQAPKAAKIYKAVYDIEGVCSNTPFESGWQNKLKVLKVRLCGKRKNCAYVIKNSCEKGYSDRMERAIEVTHSGTEQKQTTNCNIICEQSHIRHQLSKDDQLISRLLNGRTLYGRAALPEPVRYKSHFIHECAAGHGLYRDVICLPCPPGMTQDPASAHCSTCASGFTTYSYGSASCTRILPGLEEKLGKVDDSKEDKEKVPFKTRLKGLSSTTIIFIFLGMGAGVAVFAFVATTLLSLIKCRRQRKVKP
ncbi:hypothetical protein CAPTEDRAFT_196513 [Capitella teleta]|uniref:Ig-like domain-containing protein n=1 Tax=Capitella teleta TaxID=283909 RepID=R7V3J8_CAPTE|nr:hypothetical protein CAPTEDRAFT_196513 [Capitella teleta]|eukprot:ELU13423.1 hypothetical protein CAPTEDRAFT_196513 [Capitella teleta]